MPKVIRTATEILDKDAAATQPAAANPPDIDVKVAVPKPPPSPVPPKGFENPPVPLPEPAKSAPVATAPAQAEAPTPGTSTPVKKERFVKNINTCQEIVFENGSKFKFTSTCFETSDAALIAQIKAVASRYHIVQ